MKRIVLLILISIGFVFNGLCQEVVFKSVEFPKDYNAKIDVVYTEIADWQGRMDLYTNLNSPKTTPVVINIHGGGWNHGEKESQTNFKTFFKNGFAVANVEYRLVDVAPAPAAIEDVRCALIYLFRHAKDLNIDTNKIIIMGGSAGGHLALMAGLLGNDKRFDSNCKYEQEIKVAAIIDKYGLSDLSSLLQGSSVKNWLGEGYEDEEFVRSVSPFYFVSENSPPVFIVHGNADPVVPYDQSVQLFEKLKANKIKTEMLTIEGGKHGKFLPEEDSLFYDKVWKFLDELNLTKQ
ncbi:MAG: alpha/beta hydrolase [Bacteroidales bacterium]|nr:alpha/beta hydrolase [Bacteroidales bacterium]MCF8390420.1 alpha/beta hydrolase [Bacteroidales bacterium]